jgi:hypothetical protein
MVVGIVPGAERGVAAHGSYPAFFESNWPPALIQKARAAMVFVLLFGPLGLTTTNAIY